MTFDTGSLVPMFHAINVAHTLTTTPTNTHTDRQTDGQTDRDVDITEHDGDRKQFDVTSAGFTRS